MHPQRTARESSTHTVSIRTSPAEATVHRVECIQRAPTMSCTPARVHDIAGECTASPRECTASSDAMQSIHAPRTRCAVLDETMRTRSAGGPRGCARGAPTERLEAHRPHRVRAPARPAGRTRAAGVQCRLGVIRVPNSCDLSHFRG
ncbi:hypothetical protein GCM10010346_64790 [Streptomyces chryseus]|uniref:Uncharacterized protein n=1 Tax=Streptomyces chryseus TaxID=68186 RepID=A0ABQ3EBG8_9ACTN|nr:hypothetical protein GCM10010346_64790 [Streptomyces chryseus]